MFEPEELRVMLGLGEVPAELTPNHNISPGQGIPVVTNGTTRNVEIFKWGLVPGWAKNPSIGYKMINARAETIFEKPSFRNAFAKRRCLIPAGGFYEWKQEGNRKQSYLFQLKDKKPFTFAGLWERWQDECGDELLSCTIITTMPNALMAEYHDRMPVILNEKARWRWLENTAVTELREMLKPYPAEEMTSPRKLDPFELLKLAV